MEKKRVTVFVAGQRFNIITEEEERYVLDLASRVDALISSMVMSQDISRESAAVLTALDFADDCEHNRREINEIREQVKDYLARVESLTAENEELKAQLSKAKLNSDTADDLRSEAVRLRRENEALKAQVHALKEQVELLQRDDTKSAPSLDDAPADGGEGGEEKPPLPQEPPDGVAIPDEGEAAQPEVTSEDDLFFEEPAREEPVRPQGRKDKKNRHQHKHENPYRQQHMQNKEQRGYTQQRQYSLFDDEDE